MFHVVDVLYCLRPALEYWRRPRPASSRFIIHFGSKFCISFLHSSITTQHIIQCPGSGRLVEHEIRVHELIGSNKDSTVKNFHPVTSSLTGFGELTEKDTTVSPPPPSLSSRIRTILTISGHALPTKDSRLKLTLGTLSYPMEVS